jgi:hypothetical protein
MRMLSINCLKPPSIDLAFAINPDLGIVVFLAPLECFRRFLGKMAGDDFLEMTLAGYLMAAEP